MERKIEEFFFTSENEPHSLISEAFRAIRTSLHYACVDGNKKCILFTSSLPGEGKTSIAVNLAILSAREGKKVLLVDGDLRRPNLHFILNQTNRLGLSYVLTGYNELKNSITETGIANLHLLPAGPIHPSPAELLSSIRLTRLIEMCKEQYDVIYIDSPPLLSVSDANILTRSVDGIVLIVRSLIAKKEQLKKSKQILQPSKHKIVGVILNDKKLDQESVIV